MSESQRMVVVHFMFFFGSFVSRLPKNRCLAYRNEFWYIFSVLSNSHKAKDSAMKPYAVILLVFTMLGLVIFQGFQCASSEFTGAKLKMTQKNYKEAKRLLEIEVQKNPTNDEAWYLLGALSSEDQEYVRMNEAFDSALELSDKHAVDIRNIKFNRWGVHLNAGVKWLERATPESTEYFDKSIEEFNKAATAMPDTALSYRYLGYAYNNKDDFDGALKAFGTAWEKGKDAESLKRMARIYIFLGDKYKNIFESDNAEKLKALRSLQGVRKSTSRNDVISALGAPDNIRRGPKGSKKETLVYSRYNLNLEMDNGKVIQKNFSPGPYKPSIDSSNYHQAMQQYNEAIALLQKGKSVLAEDTEVLNILLQAYVQSDRIAEAVAEYERVTKANPNNKVNHYILGVLYRSAMNYKAAVAEFEAAYKLDPTYSDALFDLGATYYNWGVEILRVSDEKGEGTQEHKEKFKQALPYIEKVSEEKQDDVQVWETLGTIYAQLGMQEKAVKAFDKADAIRANK